MSKFSVGDRVRVLSWKGIALSPGQVITIGKEVSLRTAALCTYRFELYAKAGEFVVGDVVVPTGRRDTMTVESIIADGKRAILMKYGSIMGSWDVGNIRLATDEEIAMAGAETPAQKAQTPTPQEVEGGVEIPAADFDFSTIKTGDEIVVRLRVAADGADRDDKIETISSCLQNFRRFFRRDEVVSVIPAPKPKTLRERAIEAALATRVDDLDGLIPALVDAVLAEIEKGDR